MGRRNVACWVLGCLVLLAASQGSGLGTTPAGAKNGEPEGREPGSSAAGRGERFARGIRPYEKVLSVGGVPVSLQEMLDAAASEGITAQDLPDGITRVFEKVIADNYLYLHLLKTRQSLSALGRCEERYRTDVWAAQEYLQTVIDPRTAATEAELAAALPPEFLAVEASEITVATREEAQEVLERLRKGELFAELAKQRSFSPTREKGGRLKGPILAGIGTLYGKEVDDRLFAAKKPGLIDAVIETGMGFSVFRVDELTPMSPEQRDAITMSAKNKIAQAKLTDELEKITDGYPLAIRTDALREAVPSPIDHLDTVVATVGERDIPLGLVYFQWFLRPGKTGSNPTEDQWGAILKDVHAYLALNEEALAHGLMKQPNARESVLRIRKHLLVEEFIARRMGSAKVGAKEVEAEFDKTRRKLESDPVLVFDAYRFHVKELAERARRALADGKDPAEVATLLNTKTESFYAPGNRYPASTLDATLQKALRGAKKGDLAGPVERTEKEMTLYYLFQVTDVAKPTDADLAGLKERVRRRLEREKVDAELRRIVKDLFAQHPVEWVKRAEAEAYLRKALAGRGKGHGGMGGAHAQGS